MQGDREALVQEAAAIGVAVAPEAASRMLDLLALVSAAPMNLSAVRDAAEMRVKHLVDSLACLRVAGIGAGQRVVDVGSGGGFPGIPVAVMCPWAEVALVEGSGKKARFLREAVRRLGLGNASVQEARAEALARDGAWRDAADCVLARAVAPLRVLLELTLPLCRPGGRFVALKGPRAGQEVAEAGSALQALGGEVDRLQDVALPGGLGQRCLVVVNKIGSTDPRYPRRSGVPARRPL